MIYEKNVDNTAKIDTNQTDSKAVKFIYGLMCERAVGVFDSKVSILNSSSMLFRCLREILNFFELSRFYLPVYTQNFYLTKSEFWFPNYI